MKLFFLGTAEDASYLPRLKACVGSAQVAYSLEPISTWIEVKKHCESKGITQIFSTSTALLKILLHRQNEKKNPSLDNYAGSIFLRDGFEILFINPLPHLIKVSYGTFLTRHYLTKFTSPNEWPTIGAFSWCIGTPANLESAHDKYKEAILISEDIETYKENLAIRCVGYTAVFPDLSTHSIVIPCDSDYNLSWIRKFNDLPAPKIFQNGKYDLAYLSRYNAVPFNYLFDTATFFHAWYSELPKDLAFLQSFCVRNSMYWKDLAETNDLVEYYKYNALDTHATAAAFIYMLLKAPQWAKNNYLQEFPLVFPCHLSEMTGIKRDLPKLREVSGKVKAKIAEGNTSLSKMVGVPNFNTNSPVQVKALLKILGCGDLESTDETNLKKASLRHPLNYRILNKILDVRGDRKLDSTYLSEGKELKGRILCALNPHGTDTGRLASKEHHFWCGLQMQNIPQGEEVKSTLIADDDFVLVECDLEQAESRDTGYISGDEALINNVENSPDFHSSNASNFFGVPFEEIYDVHKEKVINKALRTLAKPVNHGANYNMGAGVLIDSMGEDKIWEAKVLLKLPKLWTSKQVAEHLLAQFHKTYPKIRSVYYAGVVTEVLKTHMLVSTARHDSPFQIPDHGWTRYCFGDPQKNKSDLNAYVAHPPQSLNAMTLNKAYLKVFYDIAIHPIHSKNFKLIAQIHDSILFQVRKGHEYLIAMVQERMQIPVTIKAYDGITRTFVVPAAAKAGKDGKGAHRWSETE